MKVFRAVHMAALNKFISRKATSVEERDYFVRNDIVKITWKEKDKKECVGRCVTVLYAGTLLLAVVVADQRAAPGCGTGGEATARR